MVERIILKNLIEKIGMNLRFKLYFFLNTMHVLFNQIKNIEWKDKLHIE